MAQSVISQYTRWWLLFPAFGGDLLASLTYALRLAIYTLLVGTISMGNVVGVSLQGSTNPGPPSTLTAG